jgi:SAM-dependent methyltransferase
MDFARFRQQYSQQVEEAVRFVGPRHEFFLRAKARHLLELAERRVGNPADLDALDVGCGIGLLSGLLQARFRRLYGVDLDGAMVRQAAASNPGAHFAAFDGGRLPVPDGAFDVAFAVCVLHHVPVVERRRLVAEMTRSVREGGLVVLIEHNPYNPLTRYVVASCPFDADAVLLAPAQARQLLAGARLRTLERRHILFFPWDGAPWQSLERALGWLPLGAQYSVAGTVGPPTQLP